MIIVILGAQGTGKSNLAIGKARQNRAKTVVLDRHNEYPADLTRVIGIKTPEQMELALGVVFRKYRGHTVIIDEANLFFPELFWTMPGAQHRTEYVETGRHANLTRIFIARRPATLSKQILDQANEIFIFPLHGKNDFAALGNIHHEIPARLKELKQWEFVYYQRLQVPEVMPPIPKQK